MGETYNYTHWYAYGLASNEDHLQNNLVFQPLAIARCPESLLIFLSHELFSIFQRFFFNPDFGDSFSPIEHTPAATAS